MGRQPSTSSVPLEVSHFDVAINTGGMPLWCRTAAGNFREHEGPRQLSRTHKTILLCVAGPAIGTLLLYAHSVSGELMNRAHVDPRPTGAGM